MSPTFPDLSQAAREALNRRRLAHALALPDAALLAECEIDAFVGSGPGGQHRNKTESAIRLRHVPSGLSAYAGERRSQLQNKRVALGRLRRKLLEALQVPAPRIPTRPTRAAVQRRLEHKRQLAEKKRTRRLRISPTAD